MMTINTLTSRPVLSKLKRLLVLSLTVLVCFANIEAQKYALTVQTDGTAESGTAPSGTLQVNHGQSRQVQVTNVPRGYRFRDWTEHAGSASITDVFALKTRVTLFAGDATVQANFYQEDYILTINVSGEGYVEKDPDNLFYPDGAEVSLTPVPEEGWSFSNWSGDATGSGVPLTIIMDEDKTISAIFTSGGPTAVLSGTADICSGETAELTLSLTGEGPWEVVYTDGDEDYTLGNIVDTPHVFEVSPVETKTYTLVSVKDANNVSGTVGGSGSVSVNPLPQGGTVTGEYERILVNSTTGTLTLTGYTGTIRGWQRRIDDGEWTGIPGTEETETYTETPQSTGLYLYRVVVASEKCGSDLSEHFEILVINTPNINYAGYNSSNGNLTINGQNLNVNEEIDVTKLTVSNGVNSYTFSDQTANVRPSSQTSATIVVTGLDKAYMNWIYNNDGISSKDDILYNLAASENWNGPSLEDPESQVSVSSFQLPEILSAVYNQVTYKLTVTASGLAALTGEFDIDATRFIITGKNNDSHTLTSQTQDADVQSTEMFTLTLSESDRSEIEQIIDVGGTVASTGHPYLLTVGDRWNRAVHRDYDISDFSGKQITAQEFDNQPPVASDVRISGSIEIGKTVTGEYTYFDQEGDPEGDSEYAWYRADDADGSGEMVIAGEIGKTYTPGLEDAGKFIAFEVTPVAQTGTSPGNKSSSVYYEVGNSPPRVTGFEISGKPAVCKVLTASYEYFDPEGDPEGDTKIRWYRSADDSGSEGELVHEGTDYTLVLEDEGKFIMAIITPFATAGTLEGDPVQSNYLGPVENLLPEASITGPAEFCQGSDVEIIFNLTGDGPWTVIYTDGQNEYSFTATVSPYILTVSAGGTYQIVTLIDNDGCEGAELGGQIILEAVPNIVIGDWYIENFSGPAPGWTSEAAPGSASNSWTYGQPAGEVFTSASAGGNIWYTDIANLEMEEQSWVKSPCFDFSEVKKPMIALDLWNEFGKDSDGAVLQYSLENGAVWYNVGETGQGINWYNSSLIEGLPGGQEEGWTGTDELPESGWVESRNGVDMVAGLNHVRFRIAYGSDGAGESTGGIAFDNFRIGERSRVVLVEHFTNANHEESIEANEIVNSIANSKPYDVAFISYHTSFPNNDPLNVRNPADPQTRALYYGISNAPSSVMDGGLEGDGVFDYSASEPTENLLLERALVDPDFNIGITQDQSEGDLNLSVDLTARRGLSSANLTLYVIIVESEVDASLIGLQTGAVYRNVVRKILPDGAGTVLPGNWNPGQTRNFILNWTIDDVFDSGKLAALAFVQDDITREIYQAGFSPEYSIVTSSGIIPVRPDFTNINYSPNPVKDLLFIQFEENTTEEYLLEILSVHGQVLQTNILKKGMARFEINVGNLPQGAYLLVIRKGQVLVGSAKIIVN